jgi:hypothetical protein
MARDSKLVSILPQQLTNDKIPNDVLEVLKTLVTGGSKVVAVVVSFSNVFLSAALTQLWGMVNALQVIVYTSKFNLYLPANVLTYFDAILEIAEFNIIPTDQFIDKILPFQAADKNSIFKKMG